MSTDAAPDVRLATGTLVLGGNVFGWTADEQQSFAVLDAWREAGGTHVDTADVYSAWADGNRGGESEEVLGRWMASRGCRDEVVLATKVGSLEGTTGLSADAVRRGLAASLRRLQTDRVDLYYAHRDDEATPQEETAEAFRAVVASGDARTAGASNFSSDRLASALALGTPYTCVQPLLNLLERDYEDALAPLVAREDLACFPYAALAGGFLSGKYRSGAQVDSPRAPKASRYGDARGTALLEVAEGIARDHGVPLPAVAVAWVLAQPTVTAPIVSARTPEQLADLLPARDLRLSREELERLSAA